MAPKVSRRARPYHRRMAVLPASVRVSLWATAALHGRLPLEEVPGRALPDLDHCEGLVPRLQVWRDLGERVVLVALPRPGDVTGLPRGGPELLAAATDAEEAVFVPGLGGVLVPRVRPYGPEGDQGWQAVWQAFDADPVPVHRVQALDPAEAELRLRRDLAALTDRLAAVPGLPLDGLAAGGAVRDRVDREWGLPDGPGPRVLRLLTLSGRLLAIAEAGLDRGVEAADVTSTQQRRQVLGELQDRARQALVVATNAAALELAGLR